MSWSRTQYNGAQSSAAADSLSCSLSSALAAGDLVVVCVTTDAVMAGAPSVSLSDNHSHSYTLACSQAFTSGYAQTLTAIYYTVLGAGVSSLDVTASSTTQQNWCLSVADYSAGGVPVLDSTNHATGTGTSLASGSVSLAGGDLVVGVGFSAASANSWTAGSGFTLIYSQAGSGLGSTISIASVDELNVSAGTADPSATSTQSGEWSMCGASFTTAPGLFPASGSYALTGKSASLTAAHVLHAQTGAYSLTGEPATFGLGFGLTAVSGSYALTGKSASLTVAHVLHAQAGAYGLTGESAVFYQPFVLAASAGSYALTGKSAGINPGLILTATPGVYALTGESVTISSTGILTPSAGSYSISRIPANLVAARLLIAGPGSYTLAGQPAGFVQPFTLEASPGSYTLGGQPAGLDHDRTLFASAGAYVLTGETIAIIGSEAGPVAYHVYANTGVGDPINYNTPIDTTSTLTYTTAALAYPGTWSFGVRAFDLYGEEANVDCAVTFILDSTGHDITSRPAPPTGLRAFATAGGGIRVEWGYATPAIKARTPTGFHVYIAAGSTASYTTPVATVLYSASVAGTFVANLSGLLNGVSYAIGVRAYNATAEEANTTVVTCVAVSVGPTAVESLTAVAST